VVDELSLEPVVSMYFMFSVSISLHWFLHISSFLHSLVPSFIDQRLIAELTASLKTHLEELFSKLRRSSDVV